jgi:hypothetical protein
MGKGSGGDSGAFFFGRPRLLTRRAGLFRASLRLASQARRLRPLHIPAAVYRTAFLPKHLFPYHHLPGKFGKQFSW